MHISFQESVVLEPKAYSHVQSAFEQRIMWNVTCSFSIPSDTWHFIYSPSPAPNWSVQHYLQLQWLDIKLNSLVLCLQVQSPI